VLGRSTAHAGRRSLTFRVVAASALLALLIGAGFAVLLVAVDDLRTSGRQATQAREEIGAADRLQRLVIDMETGQRGFVITRNERFLEPWDAARWAYASQVYELVHLASTSVQAKRAERIGDAIGEYLITYSVPLVTAARRNDPSVRSAFATGEGKRRVDALRARFERFDAAAQGLLSRRQERAGASARKAVLAATVGFSASIVLILLFGAYVVRTVVRPVRRTSAMASRLAEGDLAVRIPERGGGEIRTLEESFNTMGTSLEVSDARLRRLAEEQAALRRVATLVAQGATPSDVFAAVAREVGGILAANTTRVLRREPDATLTEVGGWSAPDAGATSAADDHRETASITAPITVEGGVWGEIVAEWERGRSPGGGANDHMAGFTELAATAIANAQHRAELTASRRRVVLAADESRRRIERDLHDGAQQRMIHTVITLKLAQGALERGDPRARELIREALDNAERTNDELRELAHGILPVILTRGGLREAVGALGARLPLPVSVDLPAGRLPQRLEATAYFIAAEALTNVVKHAHATSAAVGASVEGDALQLEIRDDGHGGATLGRGSGLLGLRDRAAAVDGRLSVRSVPGEGTVIAATLPITGEAPSS
jgi:signal transduction histidine kinase